MNKLLASMLSSLILSVAPNLKASENNAARLIESVKIATPIDRPAPKYPKSEAVRGREGWTQLSFVIGTDGAPYDVSVINSSGNSRIDNASIRAVKKWRYEPATNAKGEAIEQCQTRVQLDFLLNREHTVSKKFRRRMLKTLDNLRQQKVDLLAEDIKILNQLNSGKMTENTWVSYVKANYFKLIGDEDKQYFYLTKTVPHRFKKNKKHILPEDSLLVSLHQLFSLQAKRSKYHDALLTFDKLSQFDSELAIKIQTQLQPYATQIEQAIKSDKLIVVDGEIHQGRWFHNLSRGQFALNEINGQLHKLDIRCENKRRVYTVNETTTWRIPASWGSCQVLIEGDDSANFKLVELSGKA